MSLAFTTRRLAEAIREHGGNLTKVAQSFGRSRSGVAMAVSRNPALKRVVEEAREVHIDAVEDVFRENCLDPSPQFQPSRFKFLFSQARHRGYIEKQEVELSGPGGGPVITEIVIEHQAVQTIRTDAEYLDDSQTDQPALTDMPDEPVHSEPATDPSAPSIS